MATIAIIQARMGSSRLPGKVLRELAGQTALAWCHARTAACPLVDEVIVATTTQPADDALWTYCRDRGWGVARGSEDDVLSRYYVAAAECEATEVVRITSDCPLIDPDVIAGVITARRDAGADYASTSLPHPTFPLGISAEAMSFEALQRAMREDTNPAWREHVTPYLYRHPERFRLAGFSARGEGGALEDHYHHRWTLDTPEDAALLERLLGELRAAHGDRVFSWRDALAIAQAHPEWAHANAHVVQKRVE